MSTFSYHAKKRLLELYKNHSHQVGSQLFDGNPSKYRALGLERTDCITYVIDCLQAGFRGTSDDAAASKVGRLGRYGTELAKYLVNTKKWTGIHINPDEIHPDDGEQEHPYSTFIAKKKKKYYGIPMAYKVTNYRPTPKTDPDFQTVNPGRGVTPLDSVSYSALKFVDFGFGISKGGLHTWLYSKGKVYEVHWGETAASGNLYEATDLNKFMWNSGAIIIPSEQAVKLSTLSGL